MHAVSVLYRIVPSMVRQLYMTVGNNFQQVSLLHGAIMQCLTNQAALGRLLPLGILMQSSTNQAILNHEFVFCPYQPWSIAEITGDGPPCPMQQAGCEA